MNSWVLKVENYSFNFIQVELRLIFGGRFSVHSHMFYARGVTLLDPDLYRELRLELDNGPSSPMASSVFLGIQNG